MRTEKEIREESRRIRERAKNLSGFWVPELAAAAYALEWAAGKRPGPPSQDIGSTDSAHGRLAESLLKPSSKERPKKEAAAKSAKKPVKKPARRRTS